MPRSTFNLCNKHARYLTGILFLTLFADNSFSQGNLLVTPKRVVFEGSKRSEELNIANTGKDSATYVISFIQIRMKEDGSVEQITQPDSNQNFADKYLRFFPRRVILAPNEAQTVKVQFINTGDIKPGEYRSHLYFRAVPNEKPLGEKENDNNTTSISVKLVPIFGISLPVILRVGETAAKIEISDVSVKTEDNQPAVCFTFNRTGNMSSYGDVLVEYIGSSGRPTKVGVVKGLAVYTPNAYRKFKLPLDNKSSIDYHSGKLRLSYTDDSPKHNKLAEQEIVLN
jgi:P pilus assembly chaperone PapD